MESSEPSPRFSSTRENCLGHEGTLTLVESWREILRERQVRDDAEISNNTITVCVGPQFEGDISRILIFSFMLNNVTFSSELKWFK